MPGVQVVARAELAALVWAAEAANGPLRAYSDCQCVVRDTAKCPRDVPMPKMYWKGFYSLAVRPAGIPLSEGTWTTSPSRRSLPPTGVPRWH